MERILSDKDVGSADNSTLCFIGTKLICVRHLPYYRDFAPSDAVGIYYCFNSFVCFVMLILFSFFFIMEIRHTQLHLEQEKETLDAIASHDSLTQLLNRRSMEIHLHKAMEQAKRLRVKEAGPTPTPP